MTEIAEGEGTAIAPALAPKRGLAPRRGKVDAIVRSSAGRLVQDRIFDQFLIPESWPMIAPAKCLEDLDSLGLAPATRELFLAGNARRVYQLEGA